VTSQDKGKSKSRDRGKNVRGDADIVSNAPTRAAPKATAEIKWHEQAAFHVTFDRALDADQQAIWQTHIYHEESGAEQVHSGILDRSLIAWMRERAGLPADAAQLPEALAAPPIEHQLDDQRQVPAAKPAAPALLSVGELELEELLDEREVGAPAGNSRLRARLSFKLFDAASEQLMIGSPYVIQLLGYDEESNQVLLLAGTSGELQPDLASYSAELDFDLPPLGGYQLVANVILSHEGLATATLGPRLTVVP
jgi:hypothetical protein